MTQKIPFLGALLLAAGALMTTATGCELISSVDRSKIGTGGAGTGGTGGAASSSSTATGGTGGMPPACGTGVMTCTQAQDCPEPGDECKLRVCDGSGETGCCSTKDADDGTPLAAQVAGNCKKEVCTGGMPDTTQADDTDAPASQGECNTGACDASHMPVQNPKTSGAACTTGGTVCDGAGNCVECVADAQCAGNTSSGKTVCDQNHCVTPFCVDGSQDHGETDTDCGNGAVTGCNPCADGLKCAAGADCTSKVCDGTMHCASPTCTDGVQNGVETDQDCGGAACDGQGKTCGVGKGCAANADCGTKYCDTTVMPHVCKTPTCGDGVKNGNETGMDCGGTGFQGAAACPACPAGMGCNAGTDCATGFCNAMSQCATKADGATCGASGGNSECTNGNCIDGVCCNVACAGLCQACTTVKKGSGADGVCGSIGAGTDPDSECAQDPQSTCGNTGSCDGAGACQKYPAGTTCRAAADVCDVAETCPGGGAACPADAFLSGSTVCRPSAGVCDVAESCTGTSAACPTDGFLSNTTVCRPSAGACDVAEMCTGTSAACPTDGFLSNTTVCRPSAGVCDVAESCTGTSAACPADAFLPSSSVCRAYMAECDSVEFCSGSSASCPPDAVVPAGGTDPNVCDGTKACTGAGTGAANCKLANGQTCAADTDCASSMCYGGQCVASVNGCTAATALDLTGSAGPVMVTFPNSGLTYSPNCFKVKQGTDVMFMGAFSSHPLQGGTVVNGTENPASSGPFVPVTNTGTSATFTMSSTGTFPFYCVFHGSLGMDGAVFVVP